MAHVKGEVPFEVAGETHVLLLDFNALCDLEEDFPGLMDGEFEMKSPKAVRKVFAVGLRARDPGITEREAGEIIHAVGVERAGALVAEAFAASFPSAKGGDARPRKAPAKAGAGSGR